MKKNVIIAVTVLFLSLSCNFCFAGEVDVDFFGMSFHFDKAGAFRGAHNKLDKDGKWVFNPGLGLGYDFRQNIQSEGLSPIVHGGIFDNCSNNPYVFGGAGARYRKFMLGKLFWEINALGVLTYNKDWDDQRYKFRLLPYSNIGIGYDFGKNLVTFSLSYVPKSGGENSTDMLFLNLSVAF